MPQKAKGAKRRRLTQEERIDESLKDSFPASDPPAYSGAVPGGPRRDDKPDHADGKRPQRGR